MLPFGPSDMDWYLWLLSAGGLVLLTGMTYAVLLEQRTKHTYGAISVVSVLVLQVISFALIALAFFCAIFGIIRLFNPNSFGPPQQGNPRLLIPPRPTFMTSIHLGQRQVPWVGSHKD